MSHPEHESKKNHHERLGHHFILFVPVPVPVPARLVPVPVPVPVRLVPVRLVPVRLVPVRPGYSAGADATAREDTVRSGRRTGTRTCTGTGTGTGTVIYFFSCARVVFGIFAATLT
jgi:hypothetical protein